MRADSALELIVTYSADCDQLCLWSAPTTGEQWKCIRSLTIHNVSDVLLYPHVMVVATYEAVQVWK
jgi:hypothetical protein